MVALTYLGGSWVVSSQAGMVYRDLDDSPSNVSVYVASKKDIRTPPVTDEVLISTLSYR